MKLTIGGRDYTQPLTVRKDPHSGGTEADIQAQMTVLTELRNGMNTTVDAINQLEYVRAQVQTTMRSLPDGELKRAAAELEGKLERGGDEPHRSAHHRRAGRRALRGEAAVTLQLPGQRHRQQRLQARPTSTWRSPSSCRSG